ncbi:NAD-dependent epimerase/dehydratase family protein [Roseivirga thermotolerans]|uniref:NAD-dependent epimerase/dehydratase domain-containing protein n=1 Tax=Roseivirga thermotolerans TaxID=1758176 RepID=A0ABQ3I4P4_9BACT|nr:NAD(P)-dependent oxidoreductase [Roseivirga thermotolerans]GHE53505.1 hypothetical protein GCM10011340_05020 [Roseivirga thermotolerans]
MKGKSRILVLGGSGFLGRFIIEDLKANTDLKLICGDIQPPADPDIEFIHYDLLDPRSSTLIREGRLDFIINCTGQVSRPSGLCFDLNSIGIKYLAEAIEGNETRLIHISSVAVYGSYSHNIKVNERQNPESVYGACKAFAEWQLNERVDKNRLIILRFPNLYGGSQPKGIINYLVKSFLNDESLTFNNDGSMIRNYLNIEDAASVFHQIIDDFTPGTFNLFSNDQYTIKQLISLCEKISGKHLPAIFTQDKPWENIAGFDRTEEQHYQFSFKENLEDYLKSQLK